MSKPRSPIRSRIGAIDVVTGQRDDAFAAEPLGDAHPTVRTLDVVAEDALNGLDGSGDDEALAAGAVVDGVAVD
ncbi:MAG: hypothetical protein Q8P41_11680 [Pseudomonadota bacterium]|nr:hypothetical protein [Pseudomonadota bacterium]